MIPGPDQPQSSRTPTPLLRRRGYRLLCLLIGHIQHHRFRPHEKVEEHCVCRKHQALQNEIDFAGLEVLEGVKVGNIKPQTNIVALTVDEKMAKLHSSRSVQLWCGDFPAGLCRVSVGQKIHAVCLSNGCAASTSD